MALAVGFKLAPELEAALGTFKVSDSQRGMIVTIEDEVMKLHHGPTAKTSDFGDDLALLRKEVAAIGSAAFAIVRVDEKKEYALVSIMPETTKPKVKMMYASGALHLRNSSHLVCTHVHSLDTVDALGLSLFSIDEKKKELMTEGEKEEEEISKMEKVKPSAGMLPGIGGKFDGALEQAAKDFAAKKLRGFVAFIDGPLIKVEATVDFAEERSAVVGKLSGDKPRYCVIHWEEGKSVFVYVCPSGCKPKERMPYASMKAAFVAQLGGFDCTPTKNVEIDDPAETEATVAAHLAPQEEDEMKAIAPAKLGNKGPRMLI